ncbi:MAG: hypothetical protein ABIO91_01145 [Pyrinomonadaceae bacterium]
MKNTFSKTIGMASLAILLLTVLGQASVSAQEVGEKGSDGQALLIGPGARGLEGSWDVLVTPYNCQTGVPATTTPSMLTFNQGGTMTEFGTRIAPALRGPGHGIWSHGIMGEFSGTFQFFRFNADGTLAGRQIVIQNIVLNRDGSGFTSDATARVLDVAGNVLSSNCSVGVATRFE